MLVNTYAGLQPQQQRESQLHPSSAIVLRRITIPLIPATARRRGTAAGEPGGGGESASRVRAYTDPRGLAALPGVCCWAAEGCTI
jgi:hypothetical protein